MKVGELFENHRKDNFGELIIEYRDKKDYLLQRVKYSSYEAYNKYDNMKNEDLLYWFYYKDCLVVLISKEEEPQPEPEPEPDNNNEGE